MESTTHVFSEALLKHYHNILASLVDAISFIVNQRLHSVWELPAQAVNIIIVIAVLCDAPGPTRAELRPSSYMLAVYIVN